MDEGAQPWVSGVSNRRVLILGGGVAGASMAYYLTEKGYDVTIVERHGKVGGLARTCTYGGHPYKFGPHIWFWPGGKDDPINATIVNSRTTSCSTSTGSSSPMSRPTEVSLSGALRGREADAGARAD